MIVPSGYISGYANHWNEVFNRRWNLRSTLIVSFFVFVLSLMNLVFSILGYNAAEHLFECFHKTLFLHPETLRSYIIAPSSAIFVLISPYWLNFVNHFEL